MSVASKLYDFFKLYDPSEHPEFYKDISWVTYNPDMRVFNPLYCFKGNKMEYIRKITYVNCQMLHELRDNKLNTNEDLRKRLLAKNNQINELNKEIARRDGIIEQLRLQLGKSQEWQTSAGLKNEVREVVGLDPVYDETKVKDSTGRFVSLDGITKTQKEKLIFLAKYEGKDYVRIANVLGVGGSVETYASNGKRHSQEHCSIDGTHWLSWDDEYRLAKHDINAFLPVESLLRAG